MSTRYTITVELAGYWHAGTGRSDGAGADAIVARDRHGLPYLPARHLRGLLRHGVRHLEALGVVAQGATDDLFGKGTEGASERPAGSRFGTTQGRLRFGSAALSEAWRRYAREGGELGPLYPCLSGTAIADDGTVVARTLRTIEVTVPVTLVAHVDAPSGLDPAHERALELAAGIIRRVGRHRTRGLGRAALTFSREPAR